VAAVCHDLSQGHRNRFPDASLAPPSEPPIDCVPATIFGRHVSPRSATPEPPENAVDDRAVLLRWPASTAFLRLDWQQVLQNAPFRFGQIAPAQACLQKAALNQPIPSASTSFGSSSAGPISWYDGRIDECLCRGDRQGYARHPAEYMAQRARPRQNSDPAPSRLPVPRRYNRQRYSYEAAKFLRATRDRYAEPSAPWPFCWGAHRRWLASPANRRTKATTWWCSRCRNRRSRSVSDQQVEPGLSHHSTPVQPKRQKVQLGRSIWRQLTVPSGSRTQATLAKANRHQFVHAA